jgi:dihydroxy-acid dehydratase
MLCRHCRRPPCCCRGHLSPPALLRPQVQNGDIIRIDAETRSMDILGITEEQLQQRRAAWTPPPLKAKSGTLYKYIKLVAPASEGCITDA